MTHQLLAMRTPLPFAIAALLSLPLTSQTWTESAVGAGEVAADAEATIGSGPLATIQGSIDAGENADLYLIHIDDPATFSCSSVGGADWDTQMWLFGVDGEGLAFRDDDGVTMVQSTLSGQFVPQAGHYIVGISPYDIDASDASDDLWLDSPFDIERQPDGPGGLYLEQWGGGLVFGSPGSYTLTLTGASFASRLPDGPHVAWAYVSHIASSLSVPISWQHTPTGKLVTVREMSLGRYELDFGNMIGNGVPQVTAYGGKHVALVDSWNISDTPTRVRVRVFDANGNPAAGSFCVHYRSETGGNERVAHCAAQESSTANYAPAVQRNGDRGQITIQRFSPGIYRVAIPGLGQPLGFERGNVQVSACTEFGSPSVGHAIATDWYPFGSDLLVDVFTYDDTGTYGDMRFTLSYHEEAAPIPEHLGSGAHVFAGLPTDPGPYVPWWELTDSNGTSGPADSETVERVGTGHYLVSLPNVAPISSSIAIASAVSDGAYATIRSWTPNGNGGTNLRVRTWNMAGAPFDAVFSISYLTNRPAGDAATNKVIGGGCAGLKLQPDTRPVLGANWTVTMTDLPLSSLLGLVAVGLANPAFPLDGIGAPGCVAYTDIVALIGVPLLNPSYTLPLPNDVTLIGGSIFAQGVVFDPSANAFGFVTSNGLEGEMGGV